ncbi:S8 family serine peptidase [Amycolatopsis cihanbeyliensis]|uniref:Cyanobactin maturation PatA/PatG family protease n=1 Tax=Amycolatopsis cihanbeyliensis TaxID=1128664 RepID=A0A542CUX8_AMYCI|nr:S8 family serine peptidase [Amycolatopsis cihanbeyliensis]TQI94616.1 cyanobactin maturation PatA/PatG family protease [Amycolatopsis cihanbeyliensis]
MTAIEEIPGVRDLWQHTRGDPEIVVGLVEGHPDLSHPCFAGADITVIEPGWLPDIPPATPVVEHATYVASVLFGQPGSSSPGVAPRCRGIAVPAVRDPETARDPLNLARAVEVLVEAGARIIHFAPVHATLSGAAYPVLERTVAAAVDAGVLIVAPTGNDYGRTLVAPGILRGVLAVGAFDDSGIMFKFSNWGPEFGTHGIVAPGGGVTAAAPGGGAATHKGTSVSTPIVTGVAALLASLRRRRGLPADPLSVRDALVASALPCTAEQARDEPERCLAGRLNVPGATRLAAADAPDSVTLSTASADLPLPPPGTPVYPLGTIGYDFGTQRRRDRFPPLEDPRAMVRHLRDNPADAADLIWTLDLDLAPVYAIRPTGTHVAEIHRRLVRLFEYQVTPPGPGSDPSPTPFDRCSLPARVTSELTTLRSGRAVPILDVGHARGLSGWNTEYLSKQAIDRLTATMPVELRERILREFRAFLDRAYADRRNLGLSSPERALNYAVTNVMQAATVFTAATSEHLVLDAISVSRSPYGRVDSDCWDIELRFFDPAENTRAGKEWRFTIDVADVHPITFGKPKAWPARTSARV